jgi:ABC-2 type transport system ATP-binding protein
LIGNLADGVDLYDQLTGEQLITFSGMLFGLDRATIRERVADLLDLLDLEEAAGRLVSDYSAGMTKKVALAAALVHSPRLLVLDEPFESVDPVSAANIRDILQEFAKNGGTVIVSSHSMELVERMCDHVAIMAEGRVLASGTIDEVRGDADLESRFLELVGGRRHGEGPAWLLSS